MSLPVLDRLKRPLKSLRISVTDRCNLRCRYCMPEDEYVWLPRESILTFEEIARLSSVFAGLGVTKVRLTGGEPLLRHGLAQLVGLLKRDPRLADVALTTNGLLLAKSAAELKAAGLDRVTVSLDTLHPERMESFAKSDRHLSVLQGIDAARQAGFERIKLNAVVIRGFNDDEIGDLIEFGQPRGLEVRFIEYMDVGGAIRWSPGQVVSRSEILARVAERFGAATADPDSTNPSAPAERYRLADGTRFGIISSTTAPFCGSCDRSRLTADGTCSSACTRSRDLTSARPCGVAQTTRRWLRWYGMPGWGELIAERRTGFASRTGRRWSQPPCCVRTPTGRCTPGADSRPALRLETPSIRRRD